MVWTIPWKISENSENCKKIFQTIQLRISEIPGLKSYGTALFDKRSS